MEHIVIDEGSSQIKACWWDKGIKTACMPARIFDGARLTADGRYMDGAYDLDGVSYTVADAMDNAIRTNIRQYQTSDYNRIFVNECLRQNGFKGKVSITTTLPIADFFGVKPINKALIDQKKFNLMHPVVNLAGHEMAVVKEVKVSPEAIPAWHDYLLNDEGQQKLEADHTNRIMVVDIGGTTTDFTIIDGLGQMQSFDSARKGVFDIAELLSADLATSTGRVTLESYQTEQALRDRTFAGKSIADNVRTASRPVINHIVGEMFRFSPEAKNLDAILYVGGGAALIGKALSDEYGGQTILGDEYSIARGILKSQINRGAIHAN